MGARKSERVDEARARSGKRRFVFEPCGWDLFAPHAGTPEAGTVVVKCQPFGCPRNGTMGHCYVEDAVTGEFYGLVLEASLARVTS